MGVRLQSGKSLAGCVSLACLLAPLLVASVARATEAPTIRYQLEGRINGAYARGTIVAGEAAHARWRIVLEQRVLVRGRTRWIARARRTVAQRGTRTRFALRWRRPPENRLLFLRVSVYARGRLAARSATRSVRAGDPATAFFSGEGAAGADEVSADVLRLSEDAGRGFDGHWKSSTKCDPTQSVRDVPDTWNGEPITQLAGYSIGRLGPIYYLLQTYKTDRVGWSRVKYVLLIDPGAPADFEGATHLGIIHTEASCDTHPEIAPWTVLEDWMASNPDARLTILDGSDTQTDDHYTIKKYYLSMLTGFERRVLVCDTGLDHGTVMSRYASMVGAPPQLACPSGATSWDPKLGGGGATAPSPQPAPAPGGGSTPVTASPRLGISGSCTSAGGTLTGASSGFTPGGTATIRAWYPDGSEYTNLIHSTRVRSDGSIGWTWPCAGDPAGTYVTEVVDDASGASTGRVTFSIGTPPPPSRVNAYDDYGPANAGHAMCRGNPARPESMPGGTTTQSFTVPGGVASLDSAMVQIDPDASVIAHATLYVNGSWRAGSDAAAAGDTHFGFASVPVAAGDQVTLSITFTATLGKIITVYTAGSPGGVFTASNSCSDGAPNAWSNTTGLRAVVSGWSP